MKSNLSSSSRDYRSILGKKYHTEIFHCQVSLKYIELLLSRFPNHKTLGVFTVVVMWCAPRIGIMNWVWVLELVYLGAWFRILAKHPNTPLLSVISIKFRFQIHTLYFIELTFKLWNLWLVSYRWILLLFLVYERTT